MTDFTDVLSRESTNAEQEPHHVYDALRGMRIAWVSVAIALLVGVVLQVGQSIESLHVIIDDFYRGVYYRVIVMMLFGFALDIMLWYWARVLHYLIGPHDPKGDKIAWGFARWTPRIAGIIPGVSLTIAMARALESYGWFETSIWALATLLLLVVLPAMLYWFREKWFGVDASEIAHNTKKIADLPRTTKILLAVIVFLGTVGLVIFSGWPGEAIALGPVAVMFSSAIVWASLGSVLDYFGASIRKPILLVMLICVLLFSLFDLNDNHEIRQAVRPAPLPQSPATVNDGIKQWLAARQDKDIYKESAGYPVVVVSAEGGGIYAAYHAAYVLSLLQDNSHGSFAHHVFAISGVSGGSVGAAYYAAMAARKNQPESYVKMLDPMLTQDFLSPVLAAMLYPDTLQRMIPYPFGGLDRARALEDSFTRGWQLSFPGDSTFTEPFDQFGNFPNDSTPALFFNTTEVETGRKIVVSRLQCNSNTSNLFYFSNEHTDAVLSLASAATMSARFPIVTPPGYRYVVSDEVSEKAKIKRRYVDGGYYDNTGADTLSELVTELESYNNATNGKKIRIIVLRIGWADAENLGESKDESAKKGLASNDRKDRDEHQGLGDILSPIRTVYNTTSSHGEAAVRRLRAMIHQADPNAATDGAKSGNVASQSPAQFTKRDVTDGKRRIMYREFTIHNQNDVTLPLGWLLSGSGRAAIEEQTRIGDKGEQGDALEMGRNGEALYKVEKELQKTE